MTSTEHASFRLRRGDLSIEVASSNQTLRQWLFEFFAPSFEFSPLPAGAGTTRPNGNADTVWTVRDIYDNDRYTNMLDSDGPIRHSREIECVTNDGSFVKYPLWDQTEHRTTVFISTYRCLCTVDHDRNTIEIVHGDRRARPRLAIMRMIRELATTNHLRKGHVHVHASAFVTDDGAIAMAGPKRSGKTSTLINATLRDGAQYLTNDRLYLYLQDGRLVASGMPTIVSIRPPSFRLFPELAERYLQMGYRKETTLDEAQAARRTADFLEQRALMTPAQFCDLLRAEPATPAVLSKLVFPSVAPTATRTRSIPISKADAGDRLYESIFRGSSPLRTAELFRRKDEVSPPGEFELRRQCHEIAKQVPCYRCELGRDAYTTSKSVDQWRDAA